jgi:hypothetical protein
MFRSEPLSSPLFDPVRGSARFVAVVAAAGLDTARVLHPARPGR